MPTTQDTSEITIVAPTGRNHDQAHVTAHSLNALAFLGGLFNHEPAPTGLTWSICTCEAPGVLEDCLMFSPCSVSLNGVPMFLGTDWAVHPVSEVAA